MLVGRMVHELSKGVEMAEASTGSDTHAVRAGCVAGLALEPENGLLPILAAVHLRTSVP